MNQIHLKDCREILTEMKDNSVDLICTDPPYGISYRSNRQTVDRKTSVKDNVSKVVREHYFESIEEDVEEKIDVPRPYILKIDTTWGWREDVQIKAGKIYGVYLVDKGNTQFNEYHLIWLYNEVEKIGNYHTDSEDPEYNEDDEELLNDKV